MFLLLELFTFLQCQIYLNSNLNKLLHCLRFRRPDKQAIYITFPHPPPVAEYKNKVGVPRYLSKHKNQNIPSSVRFSSSPFKTTLPNVSFRNCLLTTLFASSAFFMFREPSLFRVEYFKTSLTLK